VTATVLVLLVPDSLDGERLDRALATLLPERSRAQIQKHIEAHAVQLDGEAPKRGNKTLVVAGQTIRYDPPPPEPLDLVAQDIPLDIVFEDEHLLVINKPAGLVVHPALGHHSGTLVNAVLHHVELEVDEGDVRPGIVHRLDRDTTGLIIVAKNERAHEGLARAFREREVRKQYLAVTKGVPKQRAATLDTWFGRHPTERKRFSSKVQGGKRAVTHYQTVEVFKGAALLEVSLETGRTHQIRVHLADLGHPLVGDPLYGRKGPISFERPALHAWRLAFAHPITALAMNFEAPVPPDLVALLETLRGL